MLWVCLGCLTEYAVGLPRCPHCGSSKHVEAHEMAKVTVLTGPSNGEDETPIDQQDDRLNDHSKLFTDARQWAKAIGLNVSDKGRLSQSVLDAFQKASEGQ